MNDLTVHELMGNDYYVFSRIENDGEITIEIVNEDDEIVYCEKGHPYAWEALVSFSKMVLKANERIENQLRG